MTRASPIEPGARGVAGRLPLPLTVLGPDVAALLRDADVPDHSLYLADEAASWAAALPLPERQALALLVAMLLESRGEGSTRLPLPSVAERLQRLGVGAPERAQVARLVAALVDDAAAVAPPLFGAPGDYRPFVVEGEHLYAHRDWLLETRLAQALSARLTRPLAGTDAAALESAALDAAVTAAAPSGRRWTAAQEAALRAALVRPLTVITGGPGTGKTALIAGIVRALLRLGVAPADIALAAPTGKAANRIAESLRGALDDQVAAPPAETLHRLLGFRGGRAADSAGEFRHHENHPLPHRVVLVDETSMVDLALMERLARAVRPDARLVLLGDADQLPSVEAGAVFRDLAPLAVTLTESHRMNPADPAGAAVLAAARAVQGGDLTTLAPTTKARPSDLTSRLTFSGFEHIEAAGAAPAADRRLLDAFLDVWYASRIQALPGYDELCARVYRLRGDGLDPAQGDAVGALLRHHQRHRVLALTRSSALPTGADAINAALARRAAGGSARWSAPDDPPAGAPVLMTRNDYDRGVYNGDQGVAVRVVAADGETPRLMVAFPRGQTPLALFPFEGLRHDLRIAYASTVHKAQGAELDHAALILPDRDLPLLSRELVYTALTRVRRSIVVVGRRALLDVAAARPLQRSCGLGARLGAIVRG